MAKTETEVQRIRAAVSKARAGAKAEGFRYLSYPLVVGDNNWVAVQTFYNPPIEAGDWMPPIFFGKNMLDFPSSVLNSVKYVDI